MERTEAKQFATHNHIKLNGAPSQYCRYAFVDSEEHQGDRILMGALIPVRFEKADAVRVQGEDGLPGFELRLCTFQERYESWFLCSMADLEWVLQVQGDYIQACEQLLGAPLILREALQDLRQQRKESKPFAPTPGIELFSSKNPRSESPLGGVSPATA